MLRFIRFDLARHRLSLEEKSRLVLGQIPVQKTRLQMQLKLVYTYVSQYVDQGLEPTTDRILRKQIVDSGMTQTVYQAIRDVLKNPTQLSKAKRPKRSSVVLNEKQISLPINNLLTPEEEWGTIRTDDGKLAKGEIQTASTDSKRILTPAFNTPFETSLKEISKTVRQYINRTLFCSVKEVQIKFRITKARLIEYIGFNQVLLLPHRSLLL